MFTFNIEVCILENVSPLENAVTKASQTVAKNANVMLLLHIDCCPTLF